MKKFYFENKDEGCELIKDYYKVESEVTGGELADSMVNNFDEYFDEKQDKFIAMLAIQEFRSWDWADLEDDTPEIECEVCMEWCDEKEMFINEFHDYMFQDSGKLIPSGTRVGYFTEDNDIELDEGVCYADNYRATACEHEADNMK
jgi:hypothetical protein